MAEQVLVIGSGGREHALAWKLAQSPHLKRVLVAPGNAGTANDGKISNSVISISDHAALSIYCKNQKIDLVVVGPEVPLAAGIVDDLEAAGVRCFGPTAKAAQLESSKNFSKAFLDRHGIPTARWKAFTNEEEACTFITSASFPALVVKASGLAAGKGVIVAANKEEACQAVHEIMQDKTFGAAGDTIVVEELLEGEEVSCLCFTDGITVAPMPPAQDHKRLMDGDQGPNTGGMGAYCPAPQLSQDLLLKIRNSVLQKTIDGMRKEGIPYIGVLYAGLMLTKDGPKVLEFNCRFGDPECQVILPLLKSDLYEVMQATIDQKLSNCIPVWFEDRAAVTVVMASEGYPGNYAKGLEITGFSQAKVQGLEVFHAGTTLKDGKVVTSGGRVLTVTAIKKDLISALEHANKGVEIIRFKGAIYRKDIGYRAIAFLKQSRGLTYKDSGVDIAAGNTLVQKIKPLAAATSRSGCNADLGGFAGLFDIKEAGYKDPILVSGTDGVGTKLKIAQLCNKHNAIGQDLVAMCVNDILAQGAEPLFFLDYFACGKLDVRMAQTIIAGIAEACKLAGCALLGEQLLTPTKIYSKILLPVLRSGDVKAYAHITGGGLLENIPRVLPASVGVVLDALHWKIPSIFSWLQREGNLSEEEMARTFNCGIGAVLIVQKELAGKILSDIRRREEAWLIGKVVQHQAGSAHVEVKNLLQALRANRLQSLHSKQIKMEPRKTRVGILISGTGTNMEALIASAKKPNSSAEIVVVISNKADAEGLKKAAGVGIPTKVINHKDYSNRIEFDSAVDQVLSEFSVELICLAGFMRILSGPFVSKWDGKILNIHPSLLPSFKGSNAHKLVLEAGVRVTGCTVHFVAEEVDAGAIIFQEAVPVKIGDTEKTLSERVKEAEHKAFPAAMQLVASGAVQLGRDGKLCWNLEDHH
ncbi:trifunctional purine biosynthetic protein adenosine-3 isoform X2 [Crotalus tigris]|uniref:trifunctional purine biosynthetic protein adenosine-3 isoform X2 n=1 Tax=Crotalus tigris TaxID=88082 RepID=UPI00192FAA59|nr:trifunctional purine biosynthetic protein adenosine-3 isoform X2 [Crotalus tigris]